MTAPRLPAGWEWIPGGRMGRGPCGELHLTGPGWTWWECGWCRRFAAYRCRDCARTNSTRELREAHLERMNLYYPKDTE